MLVTGKFKDGKFDHKLPKELADMLEDLAKLLRTHGSRAIHQARLQSQGSTDPTLDGVSPPKHGHDLGRVTHHMNGAYRHSLSLFQWVQTLTAHAEGVEDYEDGPRGCKSCVRNGGHWDATERDDTLYCQWCRKFRAEFGMEPPLAVLVARHRGARITTALLRAHGIETKRDVA